MIAASVSTSPADAADGRYRCRPEDFVVDEELGFEGSGDGEHVLLQVRKRGINTTALQQRIAALAGVRPNAVGFCGRKDRHAVTSQWFSVWLPGRNEAVDFHRLDDDATAVVQIARHNRKLRPGSHRGNRFRLVLRELEPDFIGLLETRLAAVAGEGFANYFGEQRFGSDAEPVRLAARLRRARRNRPAGFDLSIARAVIFNAVLDRRVADGSFNRCVAGDVLMLAGSHSVFAAPEVTAELNERVGRLDLHPTGPLYGRGDSMATGAVLAVENDVAESFADLAGAIEAIGVKPARRALRAVAADLEWRRLDDGAIELRFFLAPGCYATALLASLGAFAEGNGDYSDGEWEIG